MDILSSKIQIVKRDRNFGRVEAWVTLDLQYHPALPPRHERILASIPARGPGRLRERLTSEARRIAVLLHRSDRQEFAMAA